MTIESIINDLKKNGINSKGKLLKALQEANLDDLRGLRQSITELIIQKEGTVR